MAHVQWFCEIVYLVHIPKHRPHKTKTKHRSKPAGVAGERAKDCEEYVVFFLFRWVHVRVQTIGEDRRFISAIFIMQFT